MRAGWHAVLAQAGAAAVVAAAAIYVAARAALVPLTYDEAISVARFAAGDVLNLADFATAVNHQLNSVLLRLSAIAFGPTPWAVRLPNVAAGVVYCGCAAALMARVRHPVIGWAGLVLLIGQPYLLEFFALARGYGLAVVLFTAALLALERWDAAPPGRGRDALASWAAGLAGGAIVASYAALPAGLALLAVLAFTRRGGRPVSAVASMAWPGWRTATAGVALALVFNTLVYSRERTLSAAHDVPVQVSILGLLEEEYSRVRVYRSAAPGRLREVTRGTGPVWPFGRVDEPWDHVRLVLPAGADDDLSQVELTVGTHVHRRDRQRDGPWTTLDVDGARVLLSQPPIRWRADRAQWLAAVQYAVATTMAVLVAGALGWTLLGWLVRAGWTDGGAARAVALAGVAAASASAAPLYLLRRDGQLFYGGTGGLVDDVVGSLVRGTARGIDETLLWWIAGALGALVAGGAIAAVWGRGRSRDLGRPALLVAAIAALYVAQIVVNYVLLDVPYPYGRTAVIVLPLVVLGAVRGADVVAAVGPWPRRGVTATIVVMAMITAAHAARVGNVTTTTDWPRDAATSSMIDLVAHRTDLRTLSPGVVRLGVEWMYYPVVRYYADRRSTPSRRYDVFVLPGDGLPVDFMYGSLGLEGAYGALIQRYPESNAGLWQTQAQ